MEAKIQPQSGLGDLIQTLPTIYALAPNVTVATNHARALAPLSCDAVGVPFENGRPVTVEGFRQLRYNRYGERSYKDNYFAFDPDAKEVIDRLFADNVSEVRIAYQRYYMSAKEKPDNYIVLAPPRAAARHRGKANPFECAPAPDAALEYLKDDVRPVVIVGLDDVYPELPELHGEVYDMRNKTNFTELCALIMHADAVVSQVSAVTSLAGLFGIPTKFLKAANETEEQHRAHVRGVIWPGQEELV